MDDASRILIEAMLREEEQSFAKEKPKKSNWKEDDTLLLSLLKVHGKNYPLLLSLLNNSKSINQLKTRVSYYLTNGLLKSSEIPQNITSTNSKDIDDFEIDIDNDIDITDNPLIPSISQQNPIRIRNAIENPNSSNNSDFDFLEVDILEDSDNEPNVNTTKENTPKITTSHSSKDIVNIPEITTFHSTNDLKLENPKISTNISQEISTINCKSAILQLPLTNVLPKIVKPRKKYQAPIFNIQHLNIDITTDKIHPQEKLAIPEFFTNSTSLKYKNKNAERYTLIRNNIINLWHSKNPKYITKTMCRKILAGQGDVHSISRIWSFLDSVGTINVNATGKPKTANIRWGVPKEKKEEDNDLGKTDDEVEGKSDDEIDFTSIIGSNSKRSRRVLDEDGNWVDEKDLFSGKVIDHEEMASKTLAEQEQLSILLSKYSSNLRSNLEEEFLNDPFQLIPLIKLKDDDIPFSVEIDSNALIVFDFHCHLAHTEVIGLLGGIFNEEKNVLKVFVSYPCRSIASTHVQCEMDSTSEMKAREEFATLGFVVVGWYHSHPTFDPNPSIRDIENQTAYQKLFELSTGIQPFIGVIVNPYNQTLSSKISILGISKKPVLPYECKYAWVYSPLIPPVFHILRSLLNEYENYKYKVDLKGWYNLETMGVTRKEKLMGCIRGYLKSNDVEESEVFLHNISSLL